MSDPAAVLEELPDPVAVVAADGTVVTANERLRRLLRADPVGHPAEDALPLVDARGQDWWACARERRGDPALHARTPETPLWLATADGDRPVLATASHARAEGGVVLVLRPDRRRAHEAAQSDLVATVANELRGPVTTIRGVASQLQALGGEASPDRRRYLLSLIGTDGERIARLLDEVVDASRIDAGGLPLALEPVDVEAVLRDLVDRRGLDGVQRMRVDAEPDLPPALADPDRLDQALASLVDNALTHGAGTVTLGVRAAGRSDILVRVADEGPGIAPADRPRVFGKFVRGHEDPRRGSGLGLYVVRGIVEAHRGRIWVEEEPSSGGAVLCLTLPIAGDARGP